MNREHSNQQHGIGSLNARTTRRVRGREAQAGTETGRDRSDLRVGDKAGASVGPVRPRRSNEKRGLVGPPLFRMACCWLWLCGLLGVVSLLGHQVGAAAAENIARSDRSRPTCGDALISEGRGPVCALAPFASALRSENHGDRASSESQTLQIRELGQLGQTQKWLKRYKTGMFANLANFANTISKNQPGAVPNPAIVFRGHSEGLATRAFDCVTDNQATNASYRFVTDAKGASSFCRGDDRISAAPRAPPNHGPRRLDDTRWGQRRIEMKAAHFNVFSSLAASLPDSESGSSAIAFSKNFRAAGR